jgi:hypothetical protein
MRCGRNTTKSKTRPSCEIVAGWINFYTLRCQYLHSDIEKEKPVQLLALFNDVLDKFDKGLYEFTLHEY